MYFIHVQVPVSAWWKDDGSSSFTVVCRSGNIVVTNFKYNESSGKNQWHFDKSRNIIRIGKYNEEEKKEKRMRGSEMNETRI